MRADAKHSPKAQPRYSALPSSLAPRGLSRAQAAEYIGIGCTLFDQLVAKRVMPRPKQIGRRSIWDRLQLDRAFDELPTGDEGDREHDDVWAKCAV